MGKRRCQKKRGGGKSLTTSLQSLINKTNSHDSASFSSTSGPVTGCTGCVNGNSNIGPGCNLPTQAAATHSAKKRNSNVTCWHKRTGGRKRYKCNSYHHERFKKCGAK